MRAEGRTLERVACEGEDEGLEWYGSDVGLDRCVKSWCVALVRDEKVGRGPVQPAWLSLQRESASVGGTAAGSRRDAGDGGVAVEGTDTIGYFVGLGRVRLEVVVGVGKDGERGTRVCGREEGCTPASDPEE